MIKARKITEHGKEKRTGVQVNISGLLADISEELDEILKEVYRMIDGVFEDLDEKYAAYEAFYKIIRKTGRDMQQRASMYRNGASDEEAREVIRIRYSELSTEEKIKEMDRILMNVTNRKLAKDPEEKLAEAIGGEDGKDE